MAIDIIVEQKKTLMCISLEKSFSYYIDLILNWMKNPLHRLYFIYTKKKFLFFICIFCIFSSADIFLRIPTLLHRFFFFILLRYIFYLLRQHFRFHNQSFDWELILKNASCSYQMAKIPYWCDMWCGLYTVW